MTHANPENLSGLADIFIYANDVSNGYYAIGFLISLYLIVMMYLNMRGESPMNAAIVAGFGTAIIGLFLLLLEMINSWHFFVCVLSLIIPLIWGYLNKD